MADRKEYKLGTFADIQTGPFGSQLHAADYVLNGIPSIMPTNIGSRLNIVTDDIVCITEKDAERLKKYTVRSGDIVYSRRGDVEKCAFITSEQDGWLCGTGSLRIRFISNEIEPKFCAYYLSTPAIKSWVLNNSVGSTMPNLNSTILSNLPLQLPPLPEQQAIAEVLSSLDDKIDLLHRQNKTLEALAETLFRQWFVEEAEESWETGTLSDVASNIRRGIQPENIEGETKYVALEHIEKKHLALYASGSANQIASNKFIFERDDILFGKLRPYFHKVCFAPCSGVCSTDILVLRAKESLFFPYCLFVFFQKEVVDYSDLSSEGTRMPRTSWEILGQYPISIPDRKTILRFNEIVLPAIHKIERNIDQIRTLTTLRDTLLPKLMSGEVRVNNEK